MSYVRTSHLKPTGTGTMSVDVSDLDADAQNSGDYTARSATLANGATASTVTINPTTTCLIVVTAIAYKLHTNANDCEIQKNGVTVASTKEDSPDNTRGSNTTTLVWTETVAAGAYTYTLINGSGGNKSFMCSGITAVAIKVT